MKTQTTIILLLTLLIVGSCSKDSVNVIEEKLVLPEETYSYSSVIPNEPMWITDNTPMDNPVTDHGATLGRVLFHDKRMSKSNIISCASCHLPEFGFGDNNALSDGFVHEKTKRNSMPIINVKHKHNFFWDGRETVLEEQVLRPVSDHIEMGIEEGELVPRLERLPYYPELFEAAFGDQEITEDRIAKALSQYLRAMTTSNSKFDKVMSGEQQFTQSESRGRNLFFVDLHCASCHSGFNLGGNGASNIGLEMEYADNGYGSLPENGASMTGAFSVPSLRNVALTGPYMHDGRFSTLEEVIDHYASDVEPHDWLDSRLEFFNFGQYGTSTTDEHFLNLSMNSNEGDPLVFTLSDSEKQDLISFLNTLTDHELMNDPRFSNPFEPVD